MGLVEGGVRRFAAEEGDERRSDGGEERAVGAE
jgi:hypothetical protein